MIGYLRMKMNDRQEQLWFSFAILTSDHSYQGYLIGVFGYICKNGKSTHLFHIGLSVQIYWPWFIYISICMVRAYLIDMMQKKRRRRRRREERMPFCIIVNKLICTWTYAQLHFLILCYLASITAGHTRDTPWTNSTSLARKTILTIDW